MNTSEHLLSSTKVLIGLRVLLWELDAILECQLRQRSRLGRIRSYGAHLYRSWQVSATRTNLLDSRLQLQWQLANDFHRRYRIAPLQHEFEIALLLQEQRHSRIREHLHPRCEGLGVVGLRPVRDFMRGD